MNKTSILVDSLLERIESGRYPAGQAVPSERQFVEEFGLSRTTVRRAIDDLVQRGRLERHPGRGTFVADAAGGPKLSSGMQRQSVAVIIPTFANPYYGEMIDGIEKEARLSELRLAVGQSDYSADSESLQLIQSASDPAVCGALVVPGSVDRASQGVLQFLRSGKPLVYIGRWPNGVACDGVCIDYRVAARQAVAHLTELGHERIAYVEGLPRLPGFSPYDGYSDVMRDRRLSIDPRLVRRYDVPSELAGRSAVEDLVRERVRFTAVFARNDVTAMGVLQGLRLAGLRVPLDVSVVSIANNLWSRSLDPPLTSVDSHPSSVGQVAMRLLTDRLHGRYGGPPVRAMLEPDLIVRSSTHAAVDNVDGTTSR
ncbi:GntR family transcriptional regulator [uncultured Alsobacter sp.]|uniref:GntR family transcriptional regulator n=1 Tax=uncultured Alsobacter sp. TaxID=1748258 RepID=UPI0025D389D5|nr:GntR family transcriptional regulator [uncultured Alsobacter sp.]